MGMKSSNGSLWLGCKFHKSFNLFYIFNSFNDEILQRY